MSFKLTLEQYIELQHLCLILYMVPQQLNKMLTNAFIVYATHLSLLKRAIKKSP